MYTAYWIQNIKTVSETMENEAVKYLEEMNYVLGDYKDELILSEEDGKSCIQKKDIAPYAVSSFYAHIYCLQVLHLVSEIFNMKFNVDVAKRIIVQNEISDVKNGELLRKLCKTEKGNLAREEEQKRNDLKRRQEEKKRQQEEKKRQQEVQKHQQEVEKRRQEKQRRQQEDKKEERCLQEDKEKNRQENDQNRLNEIEQEQQKMDIEEDLKIDDEDMYESSEGAHDDTKNQITPKQIYPPRAKPRPDTHNAQKQSGAHDKQSINAYSTAAPKVKAETRKTHEEDEVF